MMYYGWLSICPACNTPYYWGLNHECGIYRAPKINQLSDDDVERIAQRVVQLLKKTSKRMAEQ